MGNLEDHIKQTEQQIDKTVKRIKKDVKALQSLVISQSLSYDILKEQYRTKTYNIASVIMDQQPCVIKKRHNMYCKLRNRAVADKSFMEDLEIIQPPIRNKSSNKPTIKSNNNVLKVAEMTSKLRNSKVSNGEKVIIREMLSKMIQELE